MRSPRHPALLLISLLLPTWLAAQELRLTENKDIIRIQSGDQTVLEYVKTAKPVPEGIDPGYSRSGYIHPVFSPAGQEVSGDFPKDHAHQHGLFFAWTKATFDGAEVDFWNQLDKKGVIEHRGVLDRQVAKDRVSFSVRQAFVTGPEDARTDALYETWNVTVYHTPENYFLFDVESIQECASAKPFINEEYYYGGMAFRGNYAWFNETADESIIPGDIQFITSEGKNRVDGNHSRPTWVTMSGQLDGAPASITIMGDPHNFRAPQPVRIHPKKPYFCFAPMVTGAFTIQPGEEYVSKYRYLVTAAPPDEKLINEIWTAFAQGSR